VRLALLALLVLASTACAQVPVAPQGAPREWTIMGYFVGDDNNSADLEANQVRNLDELAVKGSLPGYDIVVQMDRSNKTNDFLKSRYAEPNYSGATRYHVTAGKWGNVEKLGEVNMGDPKVLVDFMRWAAATYPAKHYMLIINGHGSGILSWNGPGSTSDSTPGRVVLPGLSHFIGYDSTDGDCLTIFELEAALGQFAQLPGGKKLDMLAIDGCFAGCVEALYQLRDVTDYFVASEGLVAGHGFRYTAIVDAIAAQPAVSAEALGEVIDKTYIERASGDYVLGCFRTSGADELTGALSDLAREMTAAGREVGKVAIPNLTAFGKDKYWDVSRILDSVLTGGTGLARASNAAQLTAAAQRTQKALRACRTDLWYRGDYATKKVGGLSVYWPDADTYRKYLPFYKATAFARGSLWDEFLDWRELGAKP